MSKYFEKKFIATDGIPKKSGRYFTNEGEVFINSDWKKVEGIDWYLQPIEFAPTVRVLVDELNSDADLRRSYHDNIAMAFKDEYNRCIEHSVIPGLTPEQLHEVANNAAKNFLDLFTK